MPPNIYEPYRGLEWLHDTLDPLAAGGAWHGMAPPEVTTTPFTVYALQDGSDLMVIGGYRIWSDGLYLVKACGLASADAAVFALADANDNALHRQGGIAVGTDGLMLTCTRERTQILPEVVNGASWLNVISLYRIYVQAR